MGGIVGRVGQLAYFDKKWRKMLRRENISYFHTKSMRDSDGDFAGWSRDRKAKLVNKAGDNIKAGTMFGFSIMLKKGEYLEHYRNAERPKKVQLDTMYALCFRFCAIYVADLIQKTFPSADLSLNFILESGAKNSGDAERIFKELKKEDAYKNIFNSIAFAGKEDHYALQGADYVSHTAFLAEQGEPDLTDFPAGANVRDAVKILGRKSPVFRWHMYGDLLKDIKRRTMEFDAKRLEFGRRKPAGGPAVAAD
jgi:hypothetical protein